MRRRMYLVEHDDPETGEPVPVAVTDSFERAFELTPPGVRGHVTVLWEPAPAGNAKC